MTQQLLMGNEAFAHAALEAGVNVVAGYPGTPSSEVVETVAKLHAQGRAQGVHVEWSTNEKAALELLAGAAYAGARVLFTCKMVGLNVASDALMSLNYVGIKGGTVLFVADDPGPISSQTEQDTRRFAAFAKLPVLDPSTPEEGFAMMKVAFDLSERYGTPVIVRPTTRICHASTFFEVADETCARPLPAEGFKRSPRWIIFPRRAWEAHGEINERLGAIAQDFSCENAYCRFNPMVQGADTDAPTRGIVASGVSAAYAREALRELETQAKRCGKGKLSYRLWQVGTPYPFPAQTAARFMDGLSRVLVLEELDYTLEDELLKLAGQLRLSVEICGKLTGHARDRGENDIDDIIQRLADFLQVDGLRASEAYTDAASTNAAPPASAASSASAALNLVSNAAPGSASNSAPSVALNPVLPTLPPLPTRPPVLCAGCPHRGSFYAVKRALGKTPAVLCGDIGCYTLGNAQPLDALDTCLCMGAGITMAQGFSVVEPGKKAIAFVGDSTFFASGMTGVANAVYNDHDITVFVLDNATTAMTGSQPHPGTGHTLMGAQQTPLSIDAILHALGLRCVLHANPLNLEEATSAAREAIAFAGPSAVIFESPCVQLFKPHAPAHVDTQACTGCKKCIAEIGCPAIGFDLDARGDKSKDRGQAYVDASLCNGCGLCVQICPFDALACPSSCDDASFAASRSASEKVITHD